LKAGSCGGLTDHSDTISITIRLTLWLLFDRGALTKSQKIKQNKIEQK
jgi:hypothetical protein